MVQEISSKAPGAKGIAEKTLDTVQRFWIMVKSWLLQNKQRAVTDRYDTMARKKSVFFSFFLDWVCNVKVQLIDFVKSALMIYPLVLIN